MTDSELLLGFAVLLMVGIAINIVVVLVTDKN